LAALPLFGGAYSDDSLAWTRQDTVNYLPIRAERPGARSVAKFEMVPGMQVFANIGDGPHRGGRDVEGKCFVVSGHSLYVVTPAGVATELGTIPGTGPVSMTHNQITGGNQLVIGNGLSGYVYNTATSAFTQITDEGFPGFVSCDFLGQYILGVEPQRRFWFHSDLNAATSYNTLDRYTAESAPDRIIGLVTSHSEVLVFGERTIEPWVNDPVGNAAGTAFQRNTSAIVECGCASGNTIRRLDNSVFFLSNNGQVMRLNGYTPVPISTRAMESAIAHNNWSKAFAFTWEDRGHVCYFLTFPDGLTWCYDVAQGEWSRRESYGIAAGAAQGCALAAQFAVQVERPLVGRGLQLRQDVQAGLGLRAGCLRPHRPASRGWDHPQQRQPAVARWRAHRLQHRAHGQPAAWRGHDHGQPAGPVARRGRQLSIHHRPQLSGADRRHQHRAGRIAHRPDDERHRPRHGHHDRIRGVRLDRACD
jgi:hypothetical protein